MKNEILEYFLNTDSIKGTLDIFQERFLNSYNKFKKPNKKVILKEIFHLFKHWYYSSLFEEDIYSPHNFINTQIKDKFGDNYILLPKITPVLKGKIISHFDYDYTLFTLNDHPVVDDLHKFIDYCSPDIELTKDGLFYAKDTQILMKDLTFKDFYYVNFLNAVAQKIKLLKKMPSININKACPSKDANNFFQLNKRTQLEKIVDANIDVVVQSFAELIPKGCNILTKTKIQSLLKTPSTIDDIMHDIYAPLGVNIHDIIDEHLGFDFDEDLDFDKNIANIDEKTAFLLSSYFITLIMFSMSFICTFGHYLQLIEPVSKNIFIFDAELEELYNSLNGLTPIESALFKPVTEYSLTLLGEELFLKEKKLSENPLLIETDDESFSDTYKAILEMPNDFSLNFDEFLTSLFEGAKNNKSSKNNSTKNKLPKEVEIIKDKNASYVFKVKYYHNKRSWKMIEIKGSQTLEDLHNIIFKVFELECGHMYSFFMNNKAWDETQEIPCPQSNTNKKTCNKAKIYMQNLYLKKKFLYLYNFGDEIKFEIELVDIKDIQKTAQYPRVIKESKN